MKLFSETEIIKRTLDSLTYSIQSKKDEIKNLEGQVEALQITLSNLKHWINEEAN